MTIRQPRLERVYAGMAAQERALLLHRSYIADEPEDEAVLRTAPVDQVDEVNRLTGMGVRAVQVLRPVVEDLGQRVEVLGLRWMLLDTTARWGAERSVLMSQADLAARVPIRASDHRRLVLDERARRVSREEALEIVAAHRREVDADEAPALRDAVASGRLHQHGRGPSAEFEIGQLYDWLGAECWVRPQWGAEYAVVPDAEWRSELDAVREASEWLARALHWGPGVPELVLPSLGRPWADAQDTPWNLQMRTLADSLSESIPEVWGQLLAIERAVGDLARQFGDDTILPVLHHAILLDSRSRLEAVTSVAPRLTGELAPAVIDQSGYARLRRAILR